jgi:hypothetical protein
VKTTVADVIQFSGCKDEQTSADAFIDGQASGAMSYALIKVSTSSCVVLCSLVLLLHDPFSLLSSLFSLSLSLCVVSSCSLASLVLSLFPLFSDISLSLSLSQAITDNGPTQTYAELLRNIRTTLLGKYKQLPQLSAGRRLLDLDAPFAM